MRVMKFGGASLRDGPAIERCARLIEAEARRSRLLVVVSAQEGVTAQLERAAEGAVRGDLGRWDEVRVRHRSALVQLGLPGDLLDRHLFELRAILTELARVARADRRMTDYVLSFGERMSARVVAAVLRRIGSEASPLDAYDLGMHAARRSGEGALLGAPPREVRARLEAVPGIPVVTGFLALDPEGHVTTLGPNGSDLTAVWLGEAVAAEEVVLWKAVEGFMTADPDLVPEARLVPALGREEALEFALQGADVIHAAALEPAARGGIVVRVADVRRPEAPGSRIQAETAGNAVLGIANRAALARFTEPLVLDGDAGGQLARLANALVEAGLEPRGALQTPREATVLLDDDARARAFAEGRPRGALETGLASFALIGRELAGDAALAARIAAEARSAGVEVAALPGSRAGSSLAFLTAAHSLPDLLQRLHARILGAGPLPEVELAPRQRVSPQEAGT